MPMNGRRFLAYADTAGRAHGHLVSAPTHEAAAVGYIELYSPPVDDDAEARVHVLDLEDGREHCFVINLAEGVVEPCP